MSVQMLEATQRAAVAAQSAADAAWWALAINGMIVLVAVGTTFFQEWRVSRRVGDQRKASHDGAIETLRRGRIALVRGGPHFSPGRSTSKKSTKWLQRSIVLGG